MTHSNIIFLCMSRSLTQSPSFGIPYQNIVCISHFSDACYMPRPSHLPLVDHPNNNWRSIQVMKLLIMQSSPTSRHFLPLRSEYSLQHPQYTRGVETNWAFLLKYRGSRVKITFRVVREGIPAAIITYRAVCLPAFCQSPSRWVYKWFLRLLRRALLLNF
jgi:hypothetical protein